MRERRGERRQKVLKGGQVKLTDWVFVNCIVRDISTGGARLEFEGPVYLPSEFQLHVASADITVPVTPTWQRRREAGVRFVGAGSDAASALGMRADT